MTNQITAYRYKESRQAPTRAYIAKIWLFIHYFYSSLFSLFHRGFVAAVRTRWNLIVCINNDSKKINGLLCRCV